MSRYLLPLALLLLGGCAASTPQAFYQLPAPAAQLGKVFAQWWPLHTSTPR